MKSKFTSALSVTAARVGVFALAGGMLVACSPKQHDHAHADVGNASKTGSPAASTAFPAKVAGIDPVKVKGRWVRSDGEYVLAITDIDAEGRAQAAYFNPNPIKVAWARVLNAGPALTVSVELRDEGYPGCLYKLVYNPEGDQMTGTYFQAQMQQTYTVQFGREHQR